MIQSLHTGQHEGGSTKASHRNWYRPAARASWGV